MLKAGESVPSKVELRLARLYKAAFTRQQQRHLGLLPELNSRKNSLKRQILMDNRTAVSSFITGNRLIILTFSNSPPFHPQDPLPEAPTANPTAPTNDTTTSLPPASARSPSSVSLLRMRALHIAKSKRTLPVLEADEFEELALGPVSAGLAVNESSTSGRLRENARDVGLVQVRMQNTTQLEGGATRLIYTVHLGGKPVPAETAAKDMALLSAQEVALELGAPVIIQSERERVFDLFRFMARCWWVER